MRWLILAALLLTAPVRAEEVANDPLALITAIYKTYETDRGNPDLGDVYSARLQGLLDADAKATPKGDAGTIDWDIFVGGNDWKLSNLDIALVSRTSDKAQVRARFENFKEPRDIVFDLVHENGHWLIDDISSPLPGHRFTMSKILQHAPDAFPDEKRE